MKESEEIFQQNIDFKGILIKIFRYKFYFVLAVFVALVVAYFVNKYSVRKFSNHTSILINEEKKNSFMNSDDVMSGFGMFGGIQSVENELAVLKSFSVINQAIQELNFEVSYGYEENIFPVDFISYTLDHELYENAPIHVVVDQTQNQPVGVRFYVDIINDSIFHLKCVESSVYIFDYVANNIVSQLDSINVDGRYRFGEKINDKNFSFTIFLRDNYKPGRFSGQQLHFTLNNLLGLTGLYRANLGVATTTTTSSVVNIALVGTQPKKITDFLNTLTRVYLEKNLEKKNRIAFSTIKFIDSRIADIADSLSFAESKLQTFRSRNQVMDLSFQGEKLFEKMSNLELEKADLVIQQQYYGYIKEYFEKNNDVGDLMAPSSMEVKDPVLNQLISEMLDLNGQRMSYMNENSKNLFLKDLEFQINNLKSTILENIDYNSKRITIQLRDIDSRMAKLSSQITYLPKTERELIGMERQFKLNDAIYTYLLQKRAEAQIARASNAPDYEVVDMARLFRAKLISPKTSMNNIIAVFLALFFPLAIILIKDFLNNKISDIKEVEKITNLPIIGQVLSNKYKTSAIIRDYPKSPLADTFRAIRTNLQFFAKGVDKMVILITSSMSGEGKSFCSMNIASVYALLGKRTLLLGFDLRRPALYKDLELNNNKGISTYLINEAEIDEIVQPTKIENLDLITAGPIPPNPVELIASERTRSFLNELRKRYDYIIIDSAPIGAVTDSFLLFDYADLNIFTIRHNYAIKDAVKTNLKNIESKNISNISLLINDVKMKKNSYGYTYQSKYYATEDDKSSIKKNLRLRKKKK